MFNSEKLDVWQEAIQFADLVYALTRGFPDEGRFGLTDQMRRAAVSISSKPVERFLDAPDVKHLAQARC